MMRLALVAAAVLVCTMVSMGRFAGYYTGAATETWSDLANAVLARLPAFDFSFRVAFAWPSRLAWDVQIVLGVAIGAFSVRYLLLAFRKAWAVGGLETWGDDVFAADPEMWGKGAPVAAKDGKNKQHRFFSALAVRMARSLARDRGGRGLDALPAQEAVAHRVDADQTFRGIAQ